MIGVANLSLTVADREFLVLLGPSGCGKTTTMRMIAGLEEASEGDIMIGGRRVNGLDPKDRDIAMVFQSYALYPNLTVYENIRFPLRVRRIPQAEHPERVARAAAMVELGELMDRKPAALSGGQRQRVALARAVVRQPAAFLMDEPLSNLDAKLRVSTRAQIKNLTHELAVTTIYVTHDQIEAMTLADRVVVMNKGQVQQVGTPVRDLRPPGEYLCGRLHRQSGDEPDPRPDRGGGLCGRACAGAGFRRGRRPRSRWAFVPRMRCWPRAGEVAAPIYTIENLGEADDDHRPLRRGPGGGEGCQGLSHRDWRAGRDPGAARRLPPV